MITGFLAVLLGFTVVIPAAAADFNFVHTTWTLGAIPGSTTPVTNDWPAYDFDDGHIVLTSTGLFKTISDVDGTLFITDDTDGDVGFNRSTTSISFSSSNVVGTGVSAGVVISTFEIVSVEGQVLPTGRTEMGIAYHPGVKKFYLFGGVNFNGSYSNQILQYDPVTKIITTKSAVMPSSRYGVTAAYDSIASRIYTFGGIAIGPVKVADIHEYEAFGDVLTVEPVPLPTARARMAAAYDTGTQRIYLFGGENFNGAKLDEIVSYDGVFNSIITLSTPLPSARWDVSASFDVNRKTILIFGGENSAGIGLDEILEFDGVASTFTVRSAVLPSTRTQTASAFNRITGKTYIFGGLTKEGISDQIVEFDPVADTAKLRGTVLTSSRSLAAAFYDRESQRSYIFGGELSAGGGKTPQILQYLAYTSATYISGSLDTGNESHLGLMNFNPVGQFDPKVGVSLAFRAGNTPTPDLTWSNVGQFVPIANGGSLAAIGPAQYVQFRATFTTTDLSTSAILNDLTVNYTQTAPSATLVSSAFDLGSNLAVLRSFKFKGSFPGGTGAQFQLRTAPNVGGFPGGFGPWLGPTAGDFYTDQAGGAPINPAHRDGIGDQFVQYRAILFSTGTLSIPIVSSVSISYNILPSSPILSSLIALSSEAIALTTIDRDTTEDAIIVSTGFLPSPGSVGLSIPTLDKPGTGTVQISTITGFPPNTAIFVRTRARNSTDSLDSFFSNEITTFTLANPPRSVDTTGVFGTSITVSWDTNANPISTLYELSLSTDNFNLNITTPMAFTDTLTGNTTSLTSLAGGTTYYVRLRAQNGNVIRTAFSPVISTATRVSPTTGLVGTGVGISSIVFTWDTSGPSAQYNIYSTTAGVILQTVNTASAAITGLTPNTTFSIQVEPFNAVASAGLSGPASSYSLAAAPSLLTPIPLSTGSISFSWNASNNPPYTDYEILLSTDAFLTTATTAALFTNGFTNLTTAYVNLQAGTTYSFRMRAENENGIPSAETEASTQTIPSIVSALSGTALGISSIAWNWTNTAGPTVEFYNVVRGSTGVTIATTSATAFNDTGLLPNTTYGLRIQAVNLSTAGSLPSQTTTHTLAQPPTGSSIVEIFIDSITINWDINQNPPETVYSIERSTDNVQFGLVTTSAAASMSDVNLIGNATYYYRVQALNGAGLPTTYDASISTFLAGQLSAPPSGFSAKSISGGRIHLSWTISPSSTVVKYNVYYDSGTGVIDYGVLFTSIAAPSTSFHTVPLSLGTSYFFGLRAENEKGEEENNTHVVAAAVSTAAPAALIASIRAPTPGSRVSGSHLSLIAGLDNGTPLNVSQILFQFRDVEGSGAWTAVSAVETLHPNPSTERPFVTHWNTSLLTPGIFELRAVARDAQGVDDPAPPSVRVRIDNVIPDIAENTAGTNIIQRVRVHGFAPTTTRIVDGNRNSVLTVQFSSGAINQESDILRIETDPVLKPPFKSSFSATGIIRQITLESGQTTFTVGRNAVLSFSNLDQNSDNRVDNTEVRVDNLRIAVYDTLTSQWRIEAPSSVTSDDESTLSGATPHFSLFAVVSPAATGLSGVRIYPNPYRPNNADTNDGKPWSPNDPTSGILFDSLPPTGEIRVYSVTGALVWRSPGPASGGLLRWDSINGDGIEVASGIYFVVVTDSEGNSTAGKLAVIR